MIVSMHFRNSAIGGGIELCTLTIIVRSGAAAQVERPPKKLHMHRASDKDRTAECDIDGIYVATASCRAHADGKVEQGRG
jgi:hypothetical protein